MTAAPAPPGGDQVVGTPLRARLRTWRPLLVALLLLALVTAATANRAGTGSSTRLALDNAGDDGARALGEVLRGYGVGVRATPTFEAALARAQDDPTGTTVALVEASALTTAQREALAATGADVTVLGTFLGDLEGLAPASVLAPDAASTSGALTASCEDADATAAGSVTGARGSLAVGAGATGCFPLPGGSPTTHAYAAAPLRGGGTLRVVADDSLATNAHLDEDGNAALLVRSLGHRGDVVWLDAAHQGPRTVWSTTALPPWAPVLVLQLVLTAGALALAQGRRTGRLVREELPVEVPASETVTGLGRLYEASQDRAHAARALRRGAAARLGRDLGLPRGADAGTLLDALAQRLAPGGGPASPTRQHAHGLLYGPPPSTDQELTDLAVQLDRLCTEVHHR